ncbi:MAG: hypothetical protein JW910_19875 [Anaerolineae bacterium]|nr:hypothetical protein [Anaerolineae bacterium]
MAEKKTERPHPSSSLDCCPEFPQHPVCDTLDLRYRIPTRARLGADRQEVVPAEIILHFRLERCSGPVVVGDPIYSTTLFPGETVRLFTSDRHSRWSFDSESKLSYRHETTSEESFYTAGMARAMSDLTVSESGKTASSYEESWAQGGGGAEISLFGIVSIGGGGGGGSYDSSAITEFSRSLSSHAQSASAYVAAGVRASSSTAVGEVEQRAHAEGEAEDHFESSSRTFRNPNKCHAVTYLFYKLNKLQTIRFRLVAIERHLADPQAPTGAFQRTPVDTTGRLRVLPQAVRANSKDRLELEQAARTSAFERQQAAASGGQLQRAGLTALAASPGFTTAFVGTPISPQVRGAALKALDADLAEAGLLDPKTGKPSDRIIAELSWEREEVLPTPGVIVKGCLDECDTCESALMREIDLDLARKELENELLKRQIELLDKAQEYRCCPASDGETDD